MYKSIEKLKRRRLRSNLPPVRRELRRLVRAKSRGKSFGNIPPVRRELRRLVRAKSSWE